MESGQRNGRVLKYICLLIVLGVFAVSALILVNAGVTVYKNIVLNNAANFKLRTSLSYVATRIRQSDTKGSIYLTDKEGTSVLTLEEEIEGVVYETLVYFYNGNLYELYQEKGTEYEFSTGVEVMELSGMEFEMVSDGLLKATAYSSHENREEMLIHIRTWD